MIPVYMQSQEQSTQKQTMPRKMPTLTLTRMSVNSIIMRKRNYNSPKMNLNQQRANFHILWSLLPEGRKDIVVKQ